MPGTIFNNNIESFNSLDLGFDQYGYITHERMNLKAPSVQIPGRQPLFFAPQEGERGLAIQFVYIGKNYRNDIDQFASKLYNSKQPHRIILTGEDDRYYVALVSSLPTVEEYEDRGFVDVGAQLLRNFALRRWRDDEINPSNDEINFSMPIVPAQTTFDLKGSTIVIPYCNEGIELPLSLELTGVHSPIIVANGATASYEGRASRLSLDLEAMKATEKNGIRDIDQSRRLTGDRIILPHGLQYLRVHYELQEGVVIKDVHNTASDFLKGEAVNLMIRDGATIKSENNILLIRADESEDEQELPDAVQSLPLDNPTFTRDSLAYNENGAEVGIDKPRFYSGRYGNGLLIEEPVTQELTNADLATLTEWTSSGITITDGYRGVAQVVRASGGQPVNLSQDIPATEGEAITIQTLMRKVGEVDYCELRLDFLDESDNLIGEESKPVTADLTNDWQQFSVTATAPTGTAKVRCHVISDGGTLQNQCEVEVTMPMATKTAYTWGWHLSGTKEAEVVMITEPSIFNDQAGDFGIFAYEDGTNRSGYVFDSDGSKRFALHRDGAGYHLLINGSNLVTVLIPAIGWHYWEIRWNGTAVEVYLDGERVHQETVAVRFDHTKLYLGCKNDGTSQWNSLLDSLLISNAARSDYYDPRSGNPSIDEKVSYYLPMSTIQPGDGTITTTLVAQSGGMYTSPEINLSTEQLVRRARLLFRQNGKGSVLLEYRMSRNGDWGDWRPVGFDGSIPGIRAGQSLDEVKFQYRVFFHTYNVNDPQALEQIALEVVGEYLGQLTIKNRKRLI